MSKRSVLLLTLAAGILLMLPGNAGAMTYNYTNETGNGLWNDANNWVYVESTYANTVPDLNDPNLVHQVPTSTDPNATVNIRAFPGASAISIIVPTGYTTVQPKHVYIGGGEYWDGNAAALGVNMTVQAGGTLTVPSNGNFRVGDKYDATLTNSGTVIASKYLNFGNGVAAYDDPNTLETTYHPVTTTVNQNAGSITLANGSLGQWGANGGTANININGGKVALSQTVWPGGLGIDGGYGRGWNGTGYQKSSFTMSINSGGTFDLGLRRQLRLGCGNTLDYTEAGYGGDATLNINAGSVFTSGTSDAVEEIVVGEGAAGANMTFDANVMGETRINISKDANVQFAKLMLHKVGKVTMSFEIGADKNAFIDLGTAQALIGGKFANESDLNVGQTNTSLQQSPHILDINVTGGFRPKEGQLFKLMKCLNGFKTDEWGDPNKDHNFTAFTSNITNGLPSGVTMAFDCHANMNDASWDPDYDPTHRDSESLWHYYTATFVGYTAGDINGDHTVNIGDLSLMGSNWNGTGKTWSQGDFNGNGVVDIGDLSLLGSNWNWVLAAPPVEGGEVPEPASMSLLALAGLGLLRRRK